MAHDSRTAFLSGLDALRNAVDQPFVRTADNTGDFVRRGLTVAAFNLLETFIADRLAELTTHINGGHTQYLDLPETLQRRAITNTIRVAARQQQRISDIVELRPFAAGLGGSLAAVARTINLSPLTWLWTGSNMDPDDLASALRLLHVGSPWESLRVLAGRMGFTVVDFSGQPINLKEELRNLVRERHACAHNAAHGVTTIWLRSVPEQILLYGSTFDILASLSASRIRDGDRSFLGDPSWMTSHRVSLRLVRERRNDFAEYAEGATRAFRVHRDGNVLFADACGRAQPHEVVVRQTIAGDSWLWAVPAAD